MHSLAPCDVRELCVDGQEIAILDLREELIFSRGHLLHARSLPLSRLELRMARLVPRHGARIVLCDDADGLAERASATLVRHGYTNLYVLGGGVAAWASAGFELFSGVNVPSKGFGEFVEHENETPSISADELNRLMRKGTDLVVLDSRPLDEYMRMSIPTAINVPGAELVLHIHDLAPSPDTLVVVNCAGRTRSIIGAQSLIDAGVPNKVVALRNGTMGWNLAGLTCETGRSQRASAPSDDGMAWAKSAADRVARRFGAERIDRATLDQFRSEQGQRSLYLFDVRDPAEYAAGHVAGAVSAPGGQLVQATDHYVGTLGARIVLVDDKEVRAVMTASWLRRMGWKDVFVLVEAGSETGWPEKCGTRRRTDARVAYRLRGARRATSARMRNRHRSVDQPQLSQCAYPGRVVRHTLASCSGSRPHSAARHGGPHLRRRSPRSHSGTRSLCIDEAPGPLSRGWQCGMAPSRACAFVR